MVAFLYNPPSGIAGRQSRTGGFSVVEGRVTSSTNTPSAYGLALTVDGNGQMALPGSTTTAAQIYGFNCLSYPSQDRSGGDNSAFGGTPVANVVDNVLRAGYLTVAIPTGDANPTLGGTVYIQRVAEAGYVVGQVRTQASGTPANTIALTGVTFANAGTAANGLAEIQVSLGV